MILLLDTCTFLWIIEKSPRLSQTAGDAFQDRNNEVYLSVASSWEISIKYRAGRLSLRERPEILIPKVREESEIVSLTIDEQAALLAGKLPALHNDPFDRMLVAQAIVHGMTILTPDPEIHQYAARVLW